MGVVGGTVNGYERQGTILFTLTLPLVFSNSPTRTVRESRVIERIARRGLGVIDTGGVGPAAVRMLFSGGREVAFSFCKRGVFEMFRSGTKKVVHSPRTGPRTRVLMGGPEGAISALGLGSNDGLVSVAAKGVGIRVSGGASLVGIVSLRGGTITFRRMRPMLFSGKGIAMALGRGPGRCFCNNNIRGKHFSRGKGTVGVMGRGD